MIAIFISLAINYYLFGIVSAVWAVLMPIYIFFLNESISDKDTKIFYLFLFVFLSCVFVFIFHFIAIFNGGIWLFIPASLFAFVVGLSSVYSKDLQTILTYVFFNALVSCIHALSSSPININDELMIIMIGGGVSIGVRFLISFGRYGRFTIKTFRSLLFSTRNMLDNIYSKEAFLQSKIRLAEQINNLKINLNTQSAKIKDPHLIKDMKRVLFYLQKLEDIYHSLSSVHNYFVQNANNPLYRKVKDEIDFNLNELSKIFIYKKPHIKKDELNLCCDEDKVFLSLLKIIYNKIDSFHKVSNDEIKLNVILKEKKDLSSFLSVFSLDDLTFRYAIKYAFVIAISILIAIYSRMENGIWIAIGAISMVRQNIGTIRDAIKDYLLNSFIGFIIGFIIVVLFRDSVIFIPLFSIMIFFVLYLKVYPYKIWISTLSIALVMMFALLNDDFVVLLFERLLDITIGAILVIAVFLTVLVNKRDKSTIVLFNQAIINLKELLESINNSSQPDFIKKENYYLISYHELIDITDHIHNDYHTIYTKDDIKSILKTTNYLDLLNQNLIQLNDYLHSFEIPKDEVVLYTNDVNILISRLDMLSKMLSNKSFFFRVDIEAGFLYKNEGFNAIASSIFDLQNKIYASLSPTLSRVL